MMKCSCDPATFLNNENMKRQHWNNVNKYKYKKTRGITFYSVLVWGSDPAEKLQPETELDLGSCQPAEPEQAQISEVVQCVHEDWVLVQDLVGQTWTTEWNTTVTGYSVRYKQQETQHVISNKLEPYHIVTCFKVHSFTKYNLCEKF